MILLSPGAEVTKSLSNVIKAAAITYTQEKRTIDSNKRAAEFTRLFVEKHAAVKEGMEELAAAEGTDGGFEPGLGAFVKSAGLEEDGPPAVEMPDMEEFRRQMEEEASQVREAARQEADQILAQAGTDADVIRRRAHDEGSRQGYEEGHKKAEAELARMKEGLEAEAAENRREYERQVQELEPAFVGMVIRLVERLTGVLLEDEGGIILYLLEQAMSGVEPSMTYLVHVSPEDFDTVDAKKPDLAWKIREGAALEVIEDRTLKQGQCLIETDSRVFDCSIDTQFKNLAGDLRLLAGIPGQVGPQ